MAKEVLVVHHADRRRDVVMPYPPALLVEPPDTVADRIMNFARVVGRERVIAEADCGFAQGGLYQRPHPTIMWAKVGALIAGTRLASERLWR